MFDFHDMGYDLATIFKLNILQITVSFILYTMYDNII